MNIPSLHYAAVIVLFLLGIYGMAVRDHLVKKLMAMNILQVSVILFFISLAKKDHALAPIAKEGVERAQDFVNPLPHALMLTAIVVGVSTTGVALAMLIRLYLRHGTLRESEIIEKLKL